MDATLGGKKVSYGDADVLLRKAFMSLRLVNLCSEEISAFSLIPQDDNFNILSIDCLKFTSNFVLVYNASWESDSFAHIC